MDPRLFLDSNNPQEVILALLAGKDDPKSQLIISEIFYKLQLLTTSESELSERLEELEIISILRGEKYSAINYKINHAYIIDIRKDLRFKQGKSEGFVITAENMLKDGVRIPLVHKYTGLPVAELEELAKRLYLNQTMR